MPDRSSEPLARRYVAWCRRRALAIIAAHVAVVAAALYLIAFHLPLYADFSYLLPQDAPAVKDLRKIEARVKTPDTVLVLITARTKEERAAVASEMAVEMRKLPPELVDRVDDDDSITRDFLHANRLLLAPLDDLLAARDALKKRIHDAKLAADPLYVDLEDHDAAADKAELDRLRKKRKDAEAKIDRPTMVSGDGLTAKLEVRGAFRATDAGLGHKLLTELDGISARIIAKHPQVKIGLTGSVVTSVVEHNAILNGIVLSSIVTTLLVALVLALYFRSATLLVLLVGTIAVATAGAFGAAALTVGHLNAATAFLGAIIAGNGINYGILLIARYLEERRTSDTDEALVQAIVGTLRPTAVASLGASIAYGSLAATSFKGFADFAVIGAIGMLLCWIATYLLLPALMLRFGRDTRIHTGDPLVGRILVKLLGFRNSKAVLAVSTVVGIAAAVVVARYVAHDPFEYDSKNLRSEGPDAVAARDWMKLSDDKFGRGYSGRTYIAADRLDQVRPIVDALRKRDREVPESQRAIGDIKSILDVVPEHQDKKIAVLDEIRNLLDDDALEALDDKERAELAELRPPDHLTPITIASLPPPIREVLTEKDGRVGYLVSIRPADRMDDWNGHDMVTFANAVRRLDLQDGETVTTSGPSVIFADILTSIDRDAPIVTAIAAIGLVVMVLLLVGRNRRTVAVLVATAAGSLLMVAACALLGLKVNFLDFVALPITLGLGIDYAINVAHRHESEAVPDPLETLRTSGSAVFVCSSTTIIGYGSLLVSENLAIRGFGTASLIGEIACVLTALVLVPALLAVGKRRSPRGVSAAEPAEYGV